jgi:hypothetical protein
VFDPQHCKKERGLRERCFYCENKKNTRFEYQLLYLADSWLYYYGSDVMRVLSYLAEISDAS